jgi:chemotaxis protein histidine kinase CheA
MLDNYENLTEEEKLALAEHTAVCDECRKEYDFFMSIMNTARTLPKLDVPDDFLENVNKRIDAEKNTAGAKVVRILRKDWRRYGSIAACLAVAVVIGINGDMLVSKMSPEDNGVVISESKSTSDAKPDIEENKEAATEEDAENASSAAANQDAGEAQAPSENSASEEKTAVSAPSAAPIVAAVSTAAPAKTSKVSNVLTARSTPDTSAKTESSVKETASPQTVQPTYTAAPAVKTEEKETQQPTEVKEAAAASDDNAVTSSQESSEDEPYTLARSGYTIPRAYSNAYDIKQDSDSTVSSYSIADESSDIALSSADNIKSRAAEEVQNVGSIYVGVEDSDEFMSIVNTYISGSEDEYYLISAGNLSAMLGELSESGINYGDFMGQSVNGQVAFSVVFF